jgi:hypothetical protein
VNGWKYYKSENDAKGNPTTTFIKGENIILVAQVASEVSIVGPVH